MRNVSDKSRRDTKKTHTNRQLFLNPAVYETMWKNMVEPDRPQMTVRRMRIACLIPDVTNTLCNVFPLRQSLQERVSVLHTLFMYAASLVSLLPRPRAVINPDFAQCLPAKRSKTYLLRKSRTRVALLLLFHALS